MSESRLDKLLRFLQESPKDSFLAFAIAKEYETAGQINKALNYYNNLKNNDPEYIGVYYHLGKIYEMIQQETLAKETYTQGINLAKKQGDFHSLSELNNARTNLELSQGN